jgi:hypothetical protein
VTSFFVLFTRDGPIRKFHYSAEAEYLMNATEAEAEASAEYFLPFLLISEQRFTKQQASATLCDIIVLVSAVVFQVHIT